MAIIIMVNSHYFFYEEKEVMVPLKNGFVYEQATDEWFQNNRDLEVVRIEEEKFFSVLAENQTIWLSTRVTNKDPPRKVVLTYWAYWTPPGYITTKDNLVFPQETCIISYEENCYRAGFWDFVGIIKIQNPVIIIINNNGLFLLLFLVLIIGTIGLFYYTK